MSIGFLSHGYVEQRDSDLIQPSLRLAPVSSRIHLSPQKSGRDQSVQQQYPHPSLAQNGPRRRVSQKDTLVECRSPALVRPADAKRPPTRSDVVFRPGRADAAGPHLAMRCQKPRRVAPFTHNLSGDWDENQKSAYFLTPFCCLNSQIGINEINILVSSQFNQFAMNCFLTYYVFRV